MNAGPRFNVRAFFDFPACCNLFFAGIADQQDFELENDLSAAQRVISIDGDGFPVLAGDQETPGFTPVIFHQDGGADFTVFLGNVPDVLGDDERLIPGAEYLGAVQGDFHDLLCDRQGRMLMEFVGRLETLDDDWRTICGRIGIPYERLPKKNVGQRRPYTDYYTPELRDRVARHWAREIEAFGYEYGAS